MKPVIVFDVNETLLDMAALDATFGRIVGVSAASETRKKWFKQVLELFLTGVAVGRHRPFAQLTDDALRMVAAQAGSEATEDQRAMLKAGLGELPVHPDVEAGLARLKAGGFAIAALTNSGRDAATRLLKRAGLLDRFDKVLSAEDVERHKPAPEAYQHAARSLGVELKDIVLVAAHSWDVAGALAAGCRAAFVARPGQVLSPGVPTPQFQGRNIAAVAELLIANQPGLSADAKADS